MSCSKEELAIEYLRNIDTRPGANAGEAINKNLPPYEVTPASADAEEHGSKTEHIAELERVAGLHEAAKARARKGAKAFDRWYQTLSAGDADVVDQIGDQLREIADYADAKQGEAA